MTSLLFNATATTELYTLSLHDALPICGHAALPRVRRRIEDARGGVRAGHEDPPVGEQVKPRVELGRERGVVFLAPRSEEHTSELRHVEISYAVFCLKKKNKNISYDYVK